MKLTFVIFNFQQILEGIVTVEWIVEHHQDLGIHPCLVEETTRPVVETSVEELLRTEWAGGQPGTSNPPAMTHHHEISPLPPGIFIPPETWSLKEDPHQEIGCQQGR